MKAKSNYTLRDVVGPAVKIDKDKDYCCTIKDYVAVMKRRVQDDMELIQLIEEHGGDIYIPINLILSELHKYANGRLLSPAHRFYNFVRTASDSIACYSNHRQDILEVTSVSDHCKNLLQKIKSRNEDGDDVFIRRALQRAASTAAQYVNKDKKENENGGEETAYI